MNSQLFTGYRLSAELKIKLRDKKPEGITHLLYDGKEFLGLFINESFPTLKEAKRQTDGLIACLETEFPSYRFNRASVVIFPVLLIG